MAGPLKKYQSLTSYSNILQKMKKKLKCTSFKVTVNFKNQDTNSKALPPKTSFEASKYTKQMYIMSYIITHVTFLWILSIENLVRYFELF